MRYVFLSVFSPFFSSSSSAAAEKRKKRRRRCFALRCFLRPPLFARRGKACSSPLKLRHHDEADECDVFDCSSPVVGAKKAWMPLGERRRFHRGGEGGGGGGVEGRREQRAERRTMLLKASLFLGHLLIGSPSSPPPFPCFHLRAPTSTGPLSTR